MRSLLLIALVATPLSAASAYDGFSPLSGPNTVVPSPICAVVNFGFCPQPPAPAPVAYVPNEVAVRRPALPPVAHARHRARRTSSARTGDAF